MGDGVVTRYLEVKIKTLQPVKMGGTGSQLDYESSLDYLAGSTLRGAFIGEYLKQHPVLELHEHPVERKRWLEGKIRFLNGYPAVEDRRSHPFPACFYADKSDMKLFRQRGRLDGLANILDDDERVAGQVRVKGSFVAEDQEGRWYWVETETQGKLHINLRGEQTQLYRYESIAPGQTFIAVVAMDEQDDDLLKFFLSLAGRKLHLGGSRSNGYGLCQIEDVRKVSQNPEVPSIQSDWGDDLFLLCLSDIIIRDENGRLRSSIPCSLLEEWLGVKVSLENAAVQSIVTTGFNQRWGARLPQLQAIRKGSVFKFRLQGRPDPERVQQMQDRGIGERLQDGYGRVLLLPRLHARQLILPEDKDGNETADVSGSETVAGPAMMKNMYRRIMLQRIREQREYYLLHLLQNTDDRRISSALLATWMNLLGHAMNLPPEQGKREIFEYIVNLQTRKKKDFSGEQEKKERLNKKAINALHGSKIGEERWLDFMRKAIEEADDLDALSRRIDLNWLAVPGVDKSAVFNKEETYRLTMSMLREFIRLRRKTRGRKGKGERRA